MSDLSEEVYNLKVQLSALETVVMVLVRRMDKGSRDKLLLVAEQAESIGDASADERGINQEFATMVRTMLKKSSAPIHGILIN